MSLDPSIIITGFSLGTFAYVRIALLILIGIYLLFAIMLSTKIRSLNKTVFLPPQSGEVILRLFSIFYVLLVLSLFIATLVIV